MLLGGKLSLPTFMMSRYIPTVSGCRRRSSSATKLVRVQFDSITRVDQVLRHILVIGQRLIRALGQTITAAAKARMIVVSAYPWVKTYAFYNRPRSHSVRDCVTIELVEERDSHRQLGIGKQLSRLGLATAGQQRRSI